MWHWVFQLYLMEIGLRDQLESCFFQGTWKKVAIGLKRIKHKKKVTVI